MNVDEVTKSLRRRGDPASQAAVACLDAGEGWWENVEVVQVEKELREWGREFNQIDSTIIGLEEFLPALKASAHRTLEVARLDRIVPKSGPEWFLVYLVPETSAIVTCVGGRPPERKPTRVYARSEVPDTISASASAFRSQDYEVELRRELDQEQADRLAAVFIPRGGIVYTQAASIAILGAAEVSFVSDQHWPGQALDGYLLVLDVTNTPNGERLTHVNHVLLKKTGGTAIRVTEMTYRYLPTSVPGA